ncbi:MAG: acyclic terpene utilization AtuA family protein [Isosphaeraceae bacterium]
MTNAGGSILDRAAARCAEVLSAAGLEDEPMAVVEGDDLLNRFPTWHRDGTPLIISRRVNPSTRSSIDWSGANVYLGARPIVEAMRGGARVVITGRVADASLTLGPACHAFGWSLNDWDRLAGASVAGHVIECGAQATGGLWHRWDEINDLAGIGYPIAELRDDGASLITKPEGSGGLVSVGTVSEQLVYEIDDPSRYRTPDVDVDLTSVQLESAGPDRVLIQGCRGQAPSDRLKVAAVYRDGWTASGMLAVVGRGAEAKARAAGRLILDRLRRSGHEPAESLVECLGAGGVVPGVLRNADPIVEVVLVVTVRAIPIGRKSRGFAGNLPRS